MLNQKQYDTETEGGDSNKREEVEKVKGGGSRERRGKKRARREPEEQTPSWSRVYEKNNSHITITHGPWPFHPTTGKWCAPVVSSLPKRKRNSYFLFLYLS